MATTPTTHVTLEEYFEFERKAEEKHEYYDGAIIAMAGGTPLHSFITANVSTALANALRGSGCRVFSPDLRISIRQDRFMTYPDVAVVCGRPEYSVRDRHTLVNPVVLVEVLSPSTATRDRGGKGWEYLSIPTLRNYMVIDPTPVDIGHWSRLPSGKWEMENIRDRSGTIRLESLSIDIHVTDIYFDAEFISPE